MSRQTYYCWTLVFIVVCNFQLVGGFGINVANARHSSLHPTRCFLVSEEDVLEAVEKAEDLWAQALEARKAANELSEKAEKEAQAAANSAKEIDEEFKKRDQPISMEQLTRADEAARSNLDAGSVVTKALAASDEADRLEELAEAALQKTEQQLEQHLMDYPDSPLAE